MLRRTILSLFLLSFLQIGLMAQSGLSKYEVGINAGTYIYQGDLSEVDYGSFKTPGLALGLQVTRKISPSFSVRADLGFGTLKGDDAAFAKPGWRRQRNFAFSAGLVEGSIQVLWYPLRGDQLVKPYLFAGIGIMQPRITRDYSKFNDEFFPDSVSTNLAADLAADLPGSVPVFPMGIGARVAVSKRISIAPEASFRYTSTDYLDGYSLSGEPDKRDQYFKYSIGIIYSFLKQNNYDCPPLNP